jgi:hypothetical protein
MSLISQSFIFQKIKTFFHFFEKKVKKSLQVSKNVLPLQRNRKKGVQKTPNDNCGRACSSAGRAFDF